MSGVPPRTVAVPRRVRAAVVGLVVLGYAVVLAAATSGLVPYVRIPTSVTAPHLPAGATRPPETAPVPTDGTPQTPPRSSIDLSGLLTTLLWVGAALVAAVLLRLVWRWLRRARIRTARPATTVTASAEVAEPVETAPAMSALLADGSPRNAIVACWLSLEEAATAGGVPRDPSETSAEFTARVLAHRAASAPTVRALAELYREARFSDHPITEQHRRRAVAALSLVRDDLAAGVAAP